MKDSELKRKLLIIWDMINHKKKLYHVRRKYNLSIMTAEETIEYIKNNGCSIARFGDGEFDIMLQRSAPRFQHGSEEMALKLLNVFKNESPNILICIPRAMISTKGFRKGAKRMWEGWTRENMESVVCKIREICPQGYCFGDSYVSRPYTAYKSLDYSKKMFSRLKELWNGKEVLIVEGEQTRLGVGNDLFRGAKSIKRILAPAENAFDCYSEIFLTVLSYWKGELVVLALGPTATILASDLSKRNIQVLDMGHVDIQYEWYLKGGKEFLPVKGKYTNEAIGGQNVVKCDDLEYMGQIVAKIHKK